KCIHDVLIGLFYRMAMGNNLDSTDGLLWKFKRAAAKLDIQQLSDTVETAIRFHATTESLGCPRS
ncbi:hypothetical protein, partial [Flagellimonas marinaquae]